MWFVKLCFTFRILTLQVSLIEYHILTDLVTFRETVVIAEELRITELIDVSSIEKYFFFKRSTIPCV